MAVKIVKCREETMLSEQGGEERRETFIEHLPFASTDPALYQTPRGHYFTSSSPHTVRKRYFPHLTIRKLRVREV